MMKTLLWVGLFLAWLSWVMPRGPSPAYHSLSPASAAEMDARAKRTEGSGATPEAAGNGFASSEITRSSDGHFYADAQINGARVRLMVDTGATTVALTRADAQAAGLAMAPGDFTAIGQGAGGQLKLKRVTLDRVAIGPVAATRVDAMVVEGDLPISLIGQSFLGRVGRIEIAGDRMTLR